MNKNNWYEELRSDLGKFRYDLHERESYSQLKLFSGSGINALLQTEEYGVQVMKGCCHGSLHPKVLEQRLATRLARQKAVVGSRPIRAVFTAASLCNMLLPAPGHILQLRHVIALIQDKTVDIRVLPFSMGALWPRHQKDSFMIMHDSRDDQEYVYYDDHVRQIARVIEDEAMTAVVNSDFEYFYHSALSNEESVDYIIKLIGLIQSGELL